MPVIRSVPPAPVIAPSCDPLKFPPSASVAPFSAMTPLLTQLPVRLSVPPLWTASVVASVAPLSVRLAPPGTIAGVPPLVVSVPLRIVPLLKVSGRLG